MTYSKTRPHVCITKPAHLRLARIIKARKRLGYADNNTKYLSELILNQPIPTNGNGTHAQAAAEIHALNQEAKQ